MKVRVAIALFASALSAPSFAADFSFEGVFADPNEVQSFTFTVTTPSTVTLRSYGYAGGTNAAGTLIPRGGFDPVLALFDSTGALIGQNDDGGFNVNADAVTGNRYDSFFSQSLAIGVYTTSIQAFSNFAFGPNLSDGYQGGGSFNGRNINWAFDILNVNNAVDQSVGAVPEPAAWLLMIMGFGIAGASLRKKRDKVRVNYT